MFEYIGVLISVILGLGMTHLAVGMSKLIQERETVRHYWVHILWTLNVLIHILAIWWGMYWWNDLPEWTVFQYLFITVYSVVLFLLAAMLYPWDMSKNEDFRDYFFRNRVWFFSIMLVAWLIDIPETLFKSTSSLRETPTDYAFFISSLLVICCVGIVTANRRVHAVLPFAWMLIVVGYLSFTTLSKIAE